MDPTFATYLEAEQLLARADRRFAALILAIGSGAVALLLSL